MILRDEILKQYTIDVTSGGMSGLHYDVREPSTNGKETKSLGKFDDLNKALGFAADLISMQECKDLELNLQQFSKYRQDLFKKLNESMKVNEEVAA